MFYEVSLNIPASTPPNNPANTTIRLTYGVIFRVEIQFWAGALGDVHVRILERGHQLWPTNVDEWFTGEDHVIEFDEQYMLDEEPFVLTIEGYNEDTVYPHEVVVRFGVRIMEKSLPSKLAGIVRKRRIIE